MGRLIVKRHTSPFSIKCVNCCHTENITCGLSIYTGDSADSCTLKPVALDCEMVGVGPKAINALGRVSIVDYNGAVLYDVMVRPDEEITDFRTKWSGIRPSDMRRSIPFACAQEQVARIIQDRVVIGHMVHNDFAVLRISHPAWLTRDTAKVPYAKVAAGFPSKQVIGLRALTLRLFGVHIQNGEHCSTEDARATMAIYRLIENVWESDLKRAGNLKKRPQSDVSLLSSSACEFVENMSPAPQSLKRSSTDSENLFADSSQISVAKRPCHNVVTLQKSSSSSSLLDDHFWPDD